MSEAKKDDKKSAPSPHPSDGDALDPKLIASMLKRIDDLEKLCAAAPGDEDFRRLRERIAELSNLVEANAVKSALTSHAAGVMPLPELRFDPLPHVRNKEWLPQRDGEYLMLRNVPKPTAPGVNIRDGEYKNVPCGVKLSVPQGYLAAVGQVINFGGAHQVQNVVYVSPGHTAEIEVLCTCPRGRRDYFPTPGDVIGIAWLVPAPRFDFKRDGGAPVPIAQPSTEDKHKV